MTLEQPADMVHAGQRVAGIIAARSRGDSDGARQLMASSADPSELAAGAIVVAELAAASLAQTSGTTIERCMGDLFLDMEQALN